MARYIALSKTLLTPYCSRCVYNDGVVTTRNSDMHLGRHKTDLKYSNTVIALIEQLYMYGCIL